MPPGGATDLRVRVSGEVDRTLTNSMERAAKSADKYADSLTSLELDLMRLQKQMDDDMAASLKRQEDAATKLGQGMLTAGAAIGVGLGLAAKAAIEWESAWAGVEKVTDGTPAQMAALEAELRGLATTLPATHSEIAAVAEAAGQLGVKRKDVAEFTRVMVAMGVSTNLTADEAATSMARFANIMGTPIAEVERLGSSIVALGNDGASTEAEILAMGLRIAGAGKTIGLAEADVLALANALSSVGIEAEAGGSAISTVMVNIEKAVQSGSDAVDGFAEVAGVSAQEFAKQWKRDPAAALVLFEKGLNRVRTSGGNVFGVLEELGITEIRQRDAVLRLSSAHELLADSLDTGAESWEENNALMTEANKRYETTESRAKIARNQLEDLAISLGDVLLPAIGEVAEVMTGLLGIFNGLPGPVKTGVVILGTLATTVGVLGGAALLAAPKIREAREALNELGGVGGATRKGLGGVLSILGGPWGIAIGAGITALGYFAAKQQEAAQQADALRDTLDDQTGAITDNTRAFVAKELSDRKVLAAAEALGVELSTVTDAALGNKDAQRELNAALDAYQDKLDNAEGGTLANLDANLGYEGSINLVREAVNGTNEAIVTEIANKKREITASKESSEAHGEAAEATESFGKATGITAEEVRDLEQELEELLDALHLINEESIAAEEAQIGFRDVIRDLRKEVDKGGLSLKGNSAAVDANRQKLLDGIAAAEDAAQAVGEKTAKEKGHEAAVLAANDVMRRNIRTLRDEAVRLGLNRQEVDKYIAAQLGISPKEVTKYEAPGLAGALANARALDSKNDQLDDRVVTTTYKRINYVEKRGPSLPFYDAEGGLVDHSYPGGVRYRGGKADGGMITGPGGPTDDLAGLYALSNGEYVVDARNAAKNLPLLRAISAGLVRPGGGSASSSSGGMFEGSLYLDSGQLLGLVRGEIRSSNRNTRRAVTAGAGRGR